MGFARRLAVPSRVVALILAVGLATASCGGGEGPSSTSGGDGSLATIADPTEPQSAAATWVEVSSSNLEAIRYDADAEELDVRFLSGSTYRYFGVPQAIYDGLLNPPGGSHGEYFWDHIRNDYPYEKL